MKNLKTVREKAPKKILSFFSGALGLDVGLESAGLTCLAYNEIDKIAAETIRRNRPNTRLYNSDIRVLTPERLMQECGFEREELFAIVGGPPCQAFSTAGKRAGLNDERGNVFLHFIQLIGNLRPKYAIFENVRGILSAPLVHRPHEERGRGFPPLRADEQPGGALLHILKCLEQEGYKTTFTLYNTANYGVPQVRERVIFLASREGVEIPFISPTHDELGQRGLPKWRTLRNAIAGLKDTKHQHSNFPERRLCYYRMLTAGQNWRDLPEKHQRAAMGDSYYADGGKTGFYRRLAWDKPAPTLVTAPTMPATDLCHPDELRPLSVQEYAAIQTFPAKHIFAGGLADKYRQIGNAVPCEFGRMIGEHIILFDKGGIMDADTHGKLSRYVRTDHESWRDSVTPSLFAQL